MDSLVDGSHHHFGTSRSKRVRQDFSGLLGPRQQNFFAFELLCRKRLEKALGYKLLGKDVAGEPLSSKCLSRTRADAGHSSLAEGAMVLRAVVQQAKEVANSVW